MFQAKVSGFTSRLAEYLSDLIGCDRSWTSNCSNHVFWSTQSRDGWAKVLHWFHLLSQTDISIANYPSALPLSSVSRTRRGSPTCICTLISTTSILTMCAGSTAAAAMCSWWKKMIWSVRQTDRESGECILPPPLPLKEPIKQGQCTIEWKERQRERQGWRCLYQGMYRYITVSAPLRGSAGLRQYNDMCVVRRFRLGRTQGECSYRDWGSDQITVTEIKTSWANTGQSDILTKNSGKWDVSFCVLLDL